MGLSIQSLWIVTRRRKECLGRDLQLNIGLVGPRWHHIGPQWRRLRRWHHGQPPTKSQRESQQESELGSHLEKQIEESQLKKHLEESQARFRQLPGQRHLKSGASGLAN